MDSTVAVCSVPRRSKNSINAGLVIIVSLIGLLSATVRLYFVYEVIFFNTPSQIEEIAPDSFEYLRLARNIANDLTYSQASNESRWIAFFRTPGYPLFCAIFEYLGVGVRGTIIAQAVLGTSIPIIVTFLVYLLLRSHFWAFGAGLLSALSPTGIGLTGLILADLMFAVFFFFGFFLLFVGTMFSYPRLIYGSGLVFGVSTLIKPALSLWPVLSVLVFYLLSRVKTESSPVSPVKIEKAQPIKWKHLLISIAIQMLFISGWSTRNYLNEGVFSMTPILQHNLRYHLAPEVEAAVENYGIKDLWAAEEIRTVLMERTDKRIRDGETFSSIVKSQHDESMAVFKAYPLVTTKMYMLNVAEHLSYSWNYLWRQYPFYSRYTNMFRFISYDIALNQKLKIVVYPGVVFLFVAAALPFGCLSREELRSRFYISSTFLVNFLYFAAMTGITFWAGSRLIYPAEFSLIILFVLNLQTLIKKIGFLKQD